MSIRLASYWADNAKLRETLTLKQLNTADLVWSLTLEDIINLLERDKCNRAAWLRSIVNFIAWVNEP